MGKEEVKKELLIVWKWIIKYKPVFLILIPLLLCFFLRLQPALLPVVDDWAKSSVDNSMHNQAYANINLEYPNLPEERKNELIQEKLNSYNVEQYKANVAATSEQFKSKLKDDNGDVYLSAIDPWQWYRRASNIIEHDQPGEEMHNGQYWDSTKIYPKGTRTGYSLLVVMEAYGYKLINVFTNITLMEVAFYIPMLLMLLSVVIAFFLGKNFFGDVGGFFLATYIAIQPTILARVNSGFVDTDGFQIFFPLLIAFLWMKFIHKEDKSGMIISFFGGVAIGLYSFAWSGWWYMFDFTLLASGLCILYYLINKKFSSVLWISINTIIYTIVACITTFLFMGSKVLSEFITQPLWFIGLKSVGAKNIWPKIETTIAELGSTNLTSTLLSVGGKVILCIAAIGIFYLLLNKKIREKNIKYLALIIAWLGGTLFATATGNRFVFLFIVPFGVLFAYSVQLIYNHVPGYIHKLLGASERWLKIFIIVGFVLLLLPMWNSAIDNSKRIPDINDAWVGSLKKIDAEASPYAVINSWWDFGHWFAAIGKRPTTFDGGAQVQYGAYWIGNSLLTNNENRTVGILRMLDCNADRAYKNIMKQGKTDLEAINILDEAVEITQRENAIKFYLNKGLDPNNEILIDDDAEGKDWPTTLIDSTHCLELPEDYYIMSEDMIPKSSVWGHFGSWNFTKVSMWRDVMIDGKDQSFIQKKYDLDKGTSIKEYHTILETNADTYAAPWPGMQQLSCINQENKSICQNQGIVIEINKDGFKSIGPTTPEGLVYMKDGKFIKEELENKTIGAYLLMTPKGYYISDPLVADSVFVRLFLFGGDGTTRFELFNHSVSFMNQNIYIYKVRWFE